MGSGPARSSTPTSLRTIPRLSRPGASAAGRGWVMVRATSRWHTGMEREEERRFLGEIVSAFSGRLVSIPYSSEVNDIPAFLMHHHTGEQFAQSVIDQFEVLYEEAATITRVMGIGIHIHSWWASRSARSPLPARSSTSRLARTCGRPPATRSRRGTWRQRDERGRFLAAVSRAAHGARVPQREKYGKSPRGALTHALRGPWMLRPAMGECQQPAGK